MLIEYCFNNIHQRETTFCLRQDERPAATMLYQVLYKTN
jgi:hypothetical protein